MGIFERAYAKINLSLDVLARMEDGYHSMEMVMQSVSLCDDIHIALMTAEMCCCGQTSHICHQITGI